ECLTTECLTMSESWLLHVCAFSVILHAAVVASSPASAETTTTCQTARIEQRRTTHSEFEGEAASCRGDRQCLKEAKAKSDLAMKRIDETASGCLARARAQTPPAAPPGLNWKPGDPSPQAKDGRRYIMSCSGKVLGLYKPGGAMEVELKSRPGNCIPRDDW